MKKIIFGLGLMFFAMRCEAKLISISTSTATSILPLSFFGVKTLVLSAGTTNQVYLNDEPIASTQAFVNSSLSMTSSTGLLVIPNFHGQLWGMAPNAQGAVNLFTANGQ